MAGARTDDEVELLIQVTQNYKVDKFLEHGDGESCQSKNADIYKAFMEQYAANGVAEGKCCCYELPTRAYA